MLEGFVAVEQCCTLKMSPMTNGWACLSAINLFGQYWGPKASELDSQMNS